LYIQQFFLNNSPGQAGKNGRIHRQGQSRSGYGHHAHTDYADYSTALSCYTKGIRVTYVLTKIVTTCLGVSSFTGFADHKNLTQIRSCRCASAASARLSFFLYPSALLGTLPAAAPSASRLILKTNGVEK
jgi:hypothetical protein